MNPAFLVLIGMFGTLATGGVALYVARAQKRNIDAKTEHEERSTDSVVVEVADRLIGLVDRQVVKYEDRIVRLEAENTRLISDHARCQSDLRTVRVDLDAQQHKSEQQDRRINQLVQEAENARSERIRLTELTEQLSAQVGAMQATVDADHDGTGETPAV